MPSNRDMSKYSVTITYDPHTDPVTKTFEVRTPLVNATDGDIAGIACDLGVIEPDDLQFVTDAKEVK